MEEPKEVLFSFKIEKQLKNDLKRLSIKLNISMKDLINKAITNTYESDFKKNKL